MIRVGVRIEQIMNAQTIARRLRNIAIDKTDFRIDQYGSASLRATHQIGSTASGRELLEYH
jgi:hypothetical protein